MVAYILHRKKPWGPGYFEYKWQYIEKALANFATLAAFRAQGSLPERFGAGIDERAVEYPWLFSNMPESQALLLDAGSTLNFEIALAQPALKNKKITIANLNPEPNCFWHHGISYVYEDIRHLPFISGTFDIVTCISTLEHVGMDNATLYTSDARHKENSVEDYLVAVAELRRVLKPGGTLFISVPFGKKESFGFFQQFDSEMLENVRSLFAGKCKTVLYRYAGGGWQKSNETECATAEYITAKRAQGDASLPAAATAVACLEFTK